MTKYLTKLALISLLFQPALGLAEACTYSDGKLAWDRGNLKRAEALMKMAANDGDKRAAIFLQEMQQKSPILKSPKNKATEVALLSN